MVMRGKVERAVAGVRIAEAALVGDGPCGGGGGEEAGGDDDVATLGRRDHPPGVPGPVIGIQPDLAQPAQAGKRFVALDLRKPEAIALIKELIPQIDVVVENSAPGVMARRGLGYEDLRAINPKIIMASISGFGQTGPMAEKTAFDFIAQAYSGIMHMTGEPETCKDGRPVRIAVGDDYLPARRVQAR